MTTSLPPDDALFHVSAKVFQRSAGRSAVAAAAYRSASRLMDERIGQEFDYRKKHVVESFIMAPANTPEWARDRGDLWNRVEAGERRKDAQVAREVEISIPRDIRPDDWRAFAEEVCHPYVAAGAIADVAIHCPRAADGEPQPHFHAMLTMRELDPSTPSGFARVKNLAVNAIFTSGGRHGGGERGEALTAERERIAVVMNAFLARAGSRRRASHLSNAARGLVDREPEPTMGEGRKRAAVRRKGHDRRTALVSGMRRVRVAENELAAIEEEIMATNPKFQALKGIRPRRKQDFKTRLFQDRFPDVELGDLADQLYQIDADSKPGFTAIRTRDGGWIEVEGRRVRTYGKNGAASVLARRLYEADYADDIERLEELHSVRRRGSGIRRRRSPGAIEAPIPAAEVESLADRWRSRGYTDVSEAPDGVWVRIGACRLQDLGDELRVHGPATDSAIRAMVEKAVAEWGSEIEVYGDRSFQDAAWLEAQRQGVQVYDRDTGELYEPSPDVRKAFETDLARTASRAEDMNEIRARRQVAALLKEAAASDAAALVRLENNDADLADFLALHLDANQRVELARETDADVLEALPAFRGYGRQAREDREKAGEAVRPRVVGYVVSGPSGDHEYESASLEEAYRYFDDEGGAAAGYAIGSTYSDGSSSFDPTPRRPASVPASRPA